MPYLQASHLLAPFHVHYNDSYFSPHSLFALRAARPKDLIVPHFVGCTDQSSDYVALMRRIVSLLAGHFSAPYVIIALSLHHIETQKHHSAELPDDPDAVPDAFRQWLDGLSVGAASRVGLPHVDHCPYSRVTFSSLCRNAL